MRVLGWTLYQLALAKAWHKRFSESEVEPTLRGAISVKKKWLSHRCDEPGEIRIEGVAPELDLAWACDVFDTCSR